LELQQPLHDRNQLLGIKGFSDVGICSKIRSPRLVKISPFGGANNNRQALGFLVIPQLSDYFVSIHARHNHIQYHQIGGLFLDASNGFIAIIGTDHTDASILQGRANHFLLSRNIIDNQNLSHERFS
jgi:hypothetical protein